MARDIRFYDIGGPAVGNGAQYARQGAALFNQALETAQSGLTKHEERIKENAEKEKAANTALVLKMKAEGKPVGDDFLKKLGLYDGEKINSGTLDLQKFDQDKMKNAAQIANWNSMIRDRRASRAQNSLERQLQLYAAKAAIDKKYGKYDRTMKINTNDGRACCGECDFTCR